MEKTSPSKDREVCKISSQKSLSFCMFLGRRLRLTPCGTCCLRHSILGYHIIRYDGCQDEKSSLYSNSSGRLIFLTKKDGQEASDVHPMWKLVQKAAYKQAWRCLLHQFPRRPELLLSYKKDPPVSSRRALTITFWLRSIPFSGNIWLRRIRRSRL